MSGSQQQHLATSSASSASIHLRHGVQAAQQELGGGVAEALETLIEEEPAVMEVMSHMLKENTRKGECSCRIRMLRRQSNPSCHGGR